MTDRELLLALKAQIDAHLTPVVVPPIVVPPVVVPPPPIVVPPGDHGYFDALVARPDHWKSYSLRNAAQIASHRWGSHLTTTYSPSTDTYHTPQDAAKVEVPPYLDIGTVLSGPMDAAQTKMPAYFARSGAGVSYKIDNEVLRWVAKNTDGTQTVSRGQDGTTAAPHASGAKVLAATNAAVSQIRLPMGTERGHTYLTTWDAWYGPELRTNISGLTGWKNYQFAQGTGDGTLGLEVRSRFVVSSQDNFAPDEIAFVDMRAYLALGPGVTNEPVGPQATPFKLKAATWTRYWVLLDHPASGDWDYLSLWVADAGRAPVQLLNRIAYRPGSRSFAKFWLEFSTSLETVKAGRGNLVAYVRNVAMLRDVADVTTLLVKP